MDCDLFSSGIKVGVWICEVSSGLLTTRSSMGDSLHVTYPSKNLQPRVVTSKRGHLVASTSKDLSRKTFKCITSMNQVILGKSGGSDIGLFILEIAILDIIRRFSKARWPFAWRGLQALQCFCYPPFKWIERWAPFKGAVKCMQTLSRPVLVLSIATTFSDLSGCVKETLNSSNNLQEYNDLQSEPSTSQSTHDPSRICDDIPRTLASEKWMLQLHRELEKEGLTLPERINQDELRRFYTAANGEFSSLLASIKKTIHWRQTYTILSPQELEVWSHLVFWHGRDVRHRPCLIIRLGLACSNLASKDKPCFAQAVVSQIEHGVLHLVDAENHQITVLLDCQGLSPFKFPMQMMRSIAILLQDHYPNRLGRLFVVRLPPVARVVIQTLTQVMKPVTRQKLRIIGESYHLVFSERPETLPSFLGGNCSCQNCSTDINILGLEKEKVQRQINGGGGTMNEENSSSPGSLLRGTENRIHGRWDHTLRTTIIGMLMLFMFIAFSVRMYGSKGHSMLYPWGGL